VPSVDFEKGEGQVDAEEVKRFFVGYERHVKGFKIYFPSTGKIIVVHSVKFEEGKFPCLLDTRGRDRALVRDRGKR